ncbi:molybdate ABC transporter substrate-binding protein [Anthocerotibacter panamensis]|uniref:molybdate ABC transporter substrate-binding protein n=1 Tax=Anthocerotibacter panamensis TaxID=2857077 RepID=UPI001C401580|nr:molybdate ABC transporter substrate-binding protein [Anthocerotibacter panamensis]
MKFARFWLLLLGFAVLVRPVGAAELTVAAAISLKEAFTEIAAAFEKEHPTDKIVLNFASSGQLAQQIIQGAPVDVFASAARKQIDDLDQKNVLVRDTIQPFARNRLVVIVPKGSTRLTTFEQLASVEKLTLGNPPSVPAGQYAAQALTKAKLYDALLSAQKLVFAENVRQALTYVAGGDVDAGIVYSTDARSSANVDVGFLVPVDYSEPIIYPLALVQGSKQPVLGREFIRYVKGRVGQDILRNKGFLP